MKKLISCILCLMLIFSFQPAYATDTKEAVSPNGQKMIDYFLEVMETGHYDNFKKYAAQGGQWKTVAKEPKKHFLSFVGDKEILIEYKDTYTVRGEFFYFDENKAIKYGKGKVLIHYDTFYDNVYFKSYRIECTDNFEFGSQLGTLMQILTKKYDKSYAEGLLGHTSDFNQPIGSVHHPLKKADVFKSKGATFSTITKEDVLYSSIGELHDFELTIKDIVKGDEAKKVLHDIYLGDWTVAVEPVLVKLNIKVKNPDLKAETFGLHWIPNLSYETQNKYSEAVIYTGYNYKPNGNYPLIKEQSPLYKGNTSEIEGWIMFMAPMNDNSLFLTIKYFPTESTGSDSGEYIYVDIR